MHQLFDQLRKYSCSWTIWLNCDEEMKEEKSKLITDNALSKKKNIKIISKINYHEIRIHIKCVCIWDYCSFLYSWWHQLLFYNFRCSSHLSALGHLAKSTSWHWTSQAWLTGEQNNEVTSLWYTCCWGDRLARHPPSQTLLLFLSS